jgi:hypothetical protein
MTAKYAFTLLAAAKEGTTVDSLTTIPVYILSHELSLSRGTQISTLPLPKHGLRFQPP